MLLQVLLLATIGKTIASGSGGSPLRQPTAVCHNNGPPESWCVEAVERALAGYPWNNIFLLEEQQNNFFCLLLRAEEHERGINYFVFVDEAEHPAFTVLYPETNNFLVSVDTSAAQTPQTIHALLLHEIGHTLGLPHSRDPQSIMGYFFLKKEKKNVFYQEVNYLSLTKRDLQKILLLSSPLQQADVLRAIEEAPSTLSEQREINCR
jgi:hypothetical protein